MSAWRYHRKGYASAAAALDCTYEEAWRTLAKNPVVQAALLQIEMAEAAIAATADRVYDEYEEHTE